MLRLSLSRKLALAFGLALVILIVIGSVAYRDTIRLVEVTGARAKARQFLWDLEQVASHERNAEREELGYLITGDDPRLAAFQKSVDSLAPALRTLATADPSQAAKLSALDRLMALKVQELEHVVETRQKKGLEAASAEFRTTDSSESTRLVRAAVDEIKEAEGKVLAGHAAEAKTTATRTFRTIGIGTVIALLLVSLAAVTISRGITVPVHRLGQTAEAIAAGALEARVDVRGADEIADLGHAFNRMAEALQSQNRTLRESGAAITDGVRVIMAGSDALLARSAEQSQLTDDSTASLRKVRDGVEAVFNASEKVSQRTEDSSSQALEMQSSAEEIRISMERLFSSVASTSASITQMSAASVQMTSMMSALATGGDDVLSFVSEMDATIAELGQVAHRTAELSNRVREEAVAGGGAVDETANGIEQASEVAQKAAVSLDDLQRSVGEIGRILAVIDDVTKQTNLLALNAAIIAAQAGEHGRGFSVVADEMRNMAERTGASTKEIGIIIESVRRGSRQAVQAMDESVSRVRGTVELARKATASLSVIVTSASSSSEMAERISKALEQQSQASRHLHDIASRMADHFVESNRSIQEQARGAQALAEEAERVREIAAGVRRASEEQSLSGRGIAMAIEQIDGDARAMRDLLGTQLHETDAVTTASATMREIAQQNNVLARELTDAVRGLAQSGERFEQHVRSRTA